MQFLIRVLIAVAVLYLPAQAQAESGVLTLESAHSGPETVERLEAAIKERDFVVFARLDHAAAAKAAGLEMPFSTVVVFGNPKLGTPAFVETPELAIDLPLKALVWADEDGAVSLSYNSSAYMFETIYKRHGQPYPPQMVERLEGGLADMMGAAAGVE
jgi:uncharacterized protein (DUF302 family)